MPTTERAKRASQQTAIRVGITSTFEIAAAHELPYHQGKCHRLHGHNYRLEFTRYGTPKPERHPGQLTELRPITSEAFLKPRHYDEDSDTGMVMDFGDFDAAIKAVLDRLDHYTLNDLPTPEPGLTLANPTAENLALWLLEQLPLVHKVVVWETGRHCATAERVAEG